MKRFLIALFLLLASSPLAHAQTDPTSRSWNQPVEPYRIAGNVYYVGASDITSFLITTPAGHAASGKEAPLLARGGKGDFLFGDKSTFPPIQADRILHDGDTVTLGGTTLTAHLAPGHTMGNTAWTMKAKEEGRTYDVVFAPSMSILDGVSLTKNVNYPGIGEDYGKTFRLLKSLPCDVFLGSHASFYDGLGKAERLRKGAKENPFIDPQGYRDYLARMEKKYQEQLQKERGAKP